MSRDSPQDGLSRLNDDVDRSFRTLLGSIHLERGIGRMVLLLIIAVSFFGVLRGEVFLNPVNLQNMMVASPEIGVLAVAMALAMLTGGIDLSLVAIANLTAITVSTVYSAVEANDPAQAEALAPLIILLGIAVGVSGGAVNAFLISTIGIAPILATLATMQIYNGIAVVWTGGSTLYGAPEALSTLGKSTVAGIPVLFLLFVAIALLVGVMLSRTPFGRSIMLQGANGTAAKYSGIRSASVLYGTYLTTGLLGGLAGLLILARNPTASADYGASYVLLVIVIAVLGGTNPAGGYVTVTGVVLATMVLQVVQSGFTALRLSAYEYAIAQGVILIAVMVFDQVRIKRWRRKVPDTPRRDVVAAGAVPGSDDGLPPGDREE
ncbi:ABC transporter permease [Aeromicrobium sp. CTD01-1L150]|uniref:ABC transporter permease n=1 Tax=Aeromicrobium sp. CTD01-1L150 TaxID=3341830 RepID=UPI0035C0CF11